MKGLFETLNTKRGIVFYIGTSIVIDELYRLNEAIMVGISLMFVGVILILVFTNFIFKE